MLPLPHLRKPLAGFFFGVITLVINAFLHHCPAFVEQWYSRGLFQGVRFVFDHSLGLLPFPAFYLFWIIVILWGIKLFRSRPDLKQRKQWIIYRTFQMLGFAGVLLGLFFWLWAFNYARIPIQTQLKLNVQPLDTATLWQALRSETHTLDALRQKLTQGDTNALNDIRYWPPNTEDTIRAAVEQWMSEAGFPVGGSVRGRFIYPEGTLFKFGASGIYWPFIGEGNLESGMHPLCKLPSMAHEMSHGYGFADEGICNFIAYVACTGHPNPYIAYCAHLDYWETLAGACLESDPQRYNASFKPFIPAGIVADEHAIRDQHRQFKELAPEVRYQVYDSYLKAQGIQSGMMNYDEVLMLVEAWKHSK